MATRWNAELYQSSHSFVWGFAREAVELLAPQAGERILDIGCGTGQLTREIANSGAHVTGIDRSPEMIAGARRNFPDVEFAAADAVTLPFQNGSFDAVFSNAALHWVRDAAAAAAGIAGALRPGGRLAAEFGGRGNVRALLAAFRDALGQEIPNPWFFPSVGEYAALLERHGLAVRQAVLFDRPTPLAEGARGLAKWFEMFGGPLTAAAPPADIPELIREVERRAAPELWKNDTWVVDYRRIRVLAFKEPPGA
jgi:SAM-dependent methyltransferase